MPKLPRQTRREFLVTAAQATAGAAAISGAACFPDVGGRWPRELEACAAPPEATPIARAGRVVEVHDVGSVVEVVEVIGDTERTVPTIQIDVVREMLTQGLEALAEGTERWSVLLPQVTSDTRVGLKVNCLNEQCPTSIPVVQALVESLKQGIGLSGDNIVVWDRRLDELERCGYTEETVGCRVLGTVASPKDASGPGYEVDYCHVVEGQTTRLSRILTRETDVTINVPVLKTHGVSGVTAALKNVYGVIDNPGEFHKNLNTALPAIYALPPVSGRIALTIMDALIAVTVGGTSSPPDTLARRLVLARDPLALDLHALALANQLREEKELGLAEIDPRVTGWLAEGHRLGIGAGEVALVPVLRG